MTRWHVMAGLVAVAACSDPEVAEQPEAAAITPAKDAITKVTENGPVKATVKVWPAKPSLGDPIYVRLEIDAPPGISIDAPFQEAGDQRLGRFKVVGFTRDTQRQASGGQIQEQTYTLEAQTSGRHRVPPLRLEMVDARGAGAPPAPDPDPGAHSTPGSTAAVAAGATDKGRPQELLTDEISLEVAPVKTASVDAELKPALGELDPQVGGTSWTVVLGLASIATVVLSGSLLMFRALRARRKREKQRSAYDDAVAQLRELETRGAPDAATADAWFVELSSIVRRYLEHRYDIRAPELTTEEFLLVATSRPELRPRVIDTRGPASGPGRADHRGLLTSFLERCDRVKFAGYRPDADESLATLAAARGFVEDTRLRLGAGVDAAGTAGTAADDRPRAA